MIGRHRHDHGGTGSLRPPASFGADARAEMRGRDDHGHAPSRMFEDRVRQHLPLMVREDELLRKVRLAAEVQLAAMVEGRRNHWEHAFEPRLSVRLTHERPPESDLSLCSMLLITA